MEKIKFIIDGMHCKSCEILINDALQELEGINNSKVTQGSAEVEFDESKLKKEKIAEIIKNEGFKVRR